MILQETLGHLRPPLEGSPVHESARRREGGLPPDARGLQQALQIHRQSLNNVLKSVNKMEYTENGRRRRSFISEQRTQHNISMLMLMDNIKENSALYVVTFQVVNN